MEHYDVIILGAGIAGLNAAFLAQRKGLKSLTIEALDEPGGQLTTLYAEKDIYNFPSYQKLTAFELTQKINQQIESVGAKIAYNEKVITITKEENWVVKTNKNQYSTQKIVLALGKGSFTPRKVGIDNEESLTRLFYTQTKLASVENKTIAILGGGDSALDWANHLATKNKIVLVHRRSKFRAEEKTVSEATTNPKIEFKLDYKIFEISENNQTITLNIENNQTNKVEKITADYVFVNYGFTSKLELLKNNLLELEMNRQKVIVNTYMQTNVDNIYAIGDLAYYPARVDNIMCAINDGNICINHIAKEMLKKSGIY